MGLGRLCNLLKCKSRISFFSFCFLFTTTPAAYGSSQAGSQIKLQLLAYNTTATATLDPSCICHLSYTLQPHWILNPLSMAID